MARKTFYSFHYERDSQRVAQVRNSHALADQDEYGVIDAVEWEKIERQGSDAIKRWINDQLRSTSVTVVLIGTETSEREWVQYEIRQSWERGNGLVGVRIHNVKNLDSKTDIAGQNPFDKIIIADGTPLSSICKVYDWVTDNGIKNLGQWGEDAFQTRTNYKGEIKLKTNTSISTGSIATAAYATGSSFTPTRPWGDNNHGNRGR